MVCLQDLFVYEVAPSVRVHVVVEKVSVRVHNGGANLNLAHDLHRVHRVFHVVVDQHLQLARFLLLLYLLDVVVEADFARLRREPN